MDSICGVNSSASPCSYFFNCTFELSKFNLRNPEKDKTFEAFSQLCISYMKLANVACFAMNLFSAESPCKIKDTKLYEKLQLDRDLIDTEPGCQNGLAVNH